MSAGLFSAMRHGWEATLHRQPIMLILKDSQSGPSGGTMDHRLLEIIACPVCNGKLWYNGEKQVICKLDNLAFRYARRHSCIAGK